MLLMIYLCDLWFTYDLLMIYLWNGEGGCAYHTYEKYHLLILLMKIDYYYSTYDISYTYVTYTWNAAAFGDSDDEDLNDTAEHGENMEGGGGEILNEAGTYNMAYPIHVSYLSHL